MERIHETNVQKGLLDIQKNDPIGVRSLLENQVSSAKLSESLTQQFSESLRLGIEDVIRTYGYSDDEQTRKLFDTNMTKSISLLIRSRFPMIFHSTEKSYYMYSATEKVFLEVVRDSLVESGFAFIEQAQFAVEKESGKPWQFLMNESKLRKLIKEGLRPSLGVTDGLQERNLLVFKNAVVDMSKNYRNVPEGQRLLDCPAPNGSIFNTQTLAAELVAVESRPPVWEQALILMGFDSPAMMNAIEDILIYLLSPSKSREEMFYWYGKGSNGKSVLIKFLIEVVGRRHVASISLDDLQGSGGFAWEGLIGKRLNLPAESGSSGFMDSEKLKAIITDDTISINRKNRPYIDVVLPIKFVFAANRMPVFTEKTHAMYRRFRLVRFDRAVEDHEKIQDFHEVLLAQRNEIVSWWLVNHLHRHGKFNPKFQLPEIFETWRIEAMRSEGDPVSAFVEDCMIFVDDRDTVVKSADLVKAFKDYCKEQNISIQKWGDTVICRKLNDDFELVKKSNPLATLAAEGSDVINRQYKRERYYRGVRLITQ